LSSTSEIQSINQSMESSQALVFDVKPLTGL
jgi:hypothetical protein